MGFSEIFFEVFFYLSWDFKEFFEVLKIFFDFSRGVIPNRIDHFPTTSHQIFCPLAQMIPPMVETKLPNFNFPNWALRILWDIEFLGIFWSRTGKILRFFDGIFYKGLESAKNFIKKTSYLFENPYLTIFWCGESIFDGLETISV